MVAGLCRSEIWLEVKFRREHPDRSGLSAAGWKEARKSLGRKGHLRKQDGGRASRTQLLFRIQGPEVVVCTMKRVWAPTWPQQIEFVKLSR